MAPTPTIQTAPYQTPQQLLAAQALGAQQPTGAPGVDIGALLGAGNVLAGLRAPTPAAVAPAAAGVPAAAGAGRFAGLGKAGALLASPVGRGGLYGAGGVAAGQLANKLVGEHNDTTWDEAGTGALTGAGIGAGIGTVVLPGAGTAIGAGLGALAGGLLGKVGPKDKGVGSANQELARQLASVDKMAVAAGLNEDARATLAMQLQAARAGVGSKSEMKAAGAQVASLIPQIQLQAQADEMQAQRALALQSHLAPLLAKHLERSAESARVQQALMNEAAGALQGPIADAYRTRGAQYVSDVDSQNAVLAQQAMLAGVPRPGGQQAMLQQLLGQQAQQQGEAAAKKGSTVKDIGQFITGTGVSDNIIQWAMMAQLMGNKAARTGGSGGI